MNETVLIIDQEGTELKSWEEVVNNPFKLGEKIIIKGIQYKITEVIHQLDEHGTIIKTVREGIPRD